MNCYPKKRLFLRKYFGNWENILGSLKQKFNQKSLSVKDTKMFQINGL